MYLDTARRGSVEIETQRGIGCNLSRRAAAAGKALKREHWTELGVFIDAVVWWISSDKKRTGAQNVLEMPDMHSSVDCTHQSIESGSLSELSRASIRVCNGIIYQPPTGKHWENKPTVPAGLNGCCTGRWSVFLTACNWATVSSRLKALFITVYVAV